VQQITGVASTTYIEWAHGSRTSAKPVSRAAGENSEERNSVMSQISKRLTHTFNNLFTVSRYILMLQEKAAEAQNVVPRAS
jgi:hypothetical protein